mmetsp:Transcript_13370/g.21977  ORF Transcript_13370/g.21977 Transcript_13370/m.21977 type:complete len:207 (+) Transcript_13370:858-1478(+)
MLLLQHQQHQQQLLRGIKQMTLLLQQMQLSMEQLPNYPRYKLHHQPPNRQQGMHSARQPKKPLRQDLPKNSRRNKKPRPRKRHGRRNKRNNWQRNKRPRKKKNDWSKRQKKRHERKQRNVHVKNKNGRNVNVWHVRRLRHERRRRNVHGKNLRIVVRRRRRIVSREKGWKRRLGPSWVCPPRRRRLLLLPLLDLEELLLRLLPRQQ